MMTFVRTASIEEVLAVSGKSRSDTLDLFKDRKFLEVWAWDVADFDKVRVLGIDGSGANSSVEEAEAFWKTQTLTLGATPGGDLERLAQLKRDLVANGRFYHRPILHDLSAAPSVHDGRHRVVAAHACWIEGTFRGQVEVYWITPTRVASPASVSW